MIRVATPITGPQLYVCGRRLHHFISGLALTVAGLALMVHDRADARCCWRDLRRRHR